MKNRFTQTAAFAVLPAMSAHRPGSPERGRTRWSGNGTGGPGIFAEEPEGNDAGAK